MPEIFFVILPFMQVIVLVATFLAAETSGFFIGICVTFGVSNLIFIFGDEKVKLSTLSRSQSLSVFTVTVETRSV